MQGTGDGNNDEAIIARFFNEAGPGLNTDSVFQLCRTLGRKLRGHSLAAAFRAMDTDCGGTVDVEEFRTWWEGPDGKAGADHPKAKKRRQRGAGAGAVAQGSGASAGHLPPSPEPEPEPEPQPQPQPEAKSTSALPSPSLPSPVPPLWAAAPFPFSPAATGVRRDGRSELLRAIAPRQSAAAPARLARGRGRGNGAINGARPHSAASRMQGAHATSGHEGLPGGAGRHRQVGHYIDDTAAASFRPSLWTSSPARVARMRAWGWRAAYGRPVRSHSSGQRWLVTKQRAHRRGGSPPRVRCKSARQPRDKTREDMQISASLDAEGVVNRREDSSGTDVGRQDLSGKQHRGVLRSGVQRTPRGRASAGTPGTFHSQRAAPLHPRPFRPSSASPGPPKPPATAQRQPLPRGRAAAVRSPAIRSPFKVVGFGSSSPRPLADLEELTPTAEPEPRVRLSFDHPTVPRDSFGRVLLDRGHSTTAASPLPPDSQAIKSVVASLRDAPL
jgi:hypothetical protein